jgi:hypothetical protein
MLLGFISAHQEAIIASIMLLVAGASIGNYACSVVYRLPRGQTPFEKHPYCGHCQKMLQPIDLFPVISYLITGGKCRYCGGVIPAIYTVVELVCSAIMIGYYFSFGMGELFLTYSAAAVFMVMLSAIYWSAGFVSSFLYVVVVALLLVGAALNTGHIFPAIQGFVMMLVASLSAAALQAKWRNTHLQLETLAWPWFLALAAMLFAGSHGLFVPLLPVLALCGFLALVGAARIALSVVLSGLILLMIAMQPML